MHGGGQVLAGQPGEGLGEAAGREPGLGAGDVEADHAGVAVTHGQLGDLLGAVQVAHGGDQLAGLDGGAGGLGCVHALLQSGLDGLHGLVQGQSLLQVLLGSPADLGVDHAVLHQVLHELAGHTAQALGGLHDRDGVLEGLQVALEGAGVGGLGEPGGQVIGVVRGQLVADLLGQLQHGGRAQSAVQVVVQADLGQGGQVDLQGGGGVEAEGALGQLLVQLIGEVVRVLGRVLGRSLSHGASLRRPRPPPGAVRGWRPGPGAAPARRSA